MIRFKLVDVVAVLAMPLLCFASYSASVSTPTDGSPVKPVLGTGCKGFNVAVNKAQLKQILEEKDRLSDPRTGEEFAVDCDGCSIVNSTYQYWHKQASPGTDCDGAGGNYNHFKYRRWLKFVECPAGAKATCCTQWEYLNCYPTYDTQPLCKDPNWGNQMCTGGICPP